MQDSISKTSKENFGKSAAFAFSGAAAGIIKGFTLHHGFPFLVTLNKQVRNGEIPLPELAVLSPAETDGEPLDTNDGNNHMEVEETLPVTNRTADQDNMDVEPILY